ncbi:hypothetical protein BD414DRAFT_496110 [Trametes punicea]|nr:hypothetical protein BD414DRAFT_496110 [Trametes punicea]
MAFTHSGVCALCMCCARGRSQRREKVQAMGASWRLAIFGRTRQAHRSAVELYGRSSILQQSSLDRHIRRSTSGMFRLGTIPADNRDVEALMHRTRSPARQLRTSESAEDVEGLSTGSALLSGTGPRNPKVVSIKRLQSSSAARRPISVPSTERRTISTQRLYSCPQHIPRCLIAYSAI